jgi:hypothetical protein
VRHLVAPRPGPAVEVLECREARALEERLPDVPDGPLHLALLVALAGGAGARLEVVVRAQLEEARVEVDGAALALEHCGLEVVVENHPRTPGEETEGGDVAPEEVLLALVEEELQIESAGEAERHHEARQPPPPVPIIRETAALGRLV